MSDASTYLIDSLISVFVPEFDNNVLVEVLRGTCTDEATKRAVKWGIYVSH
jgi:hypothetical protein